MHNPYSPRSLCGVPSLGKVVVEKAVENRVGACAGDAEHVADEEGQHHLLCINNNDNDYGNYSIQMQ